MAWSDAGIPARFKIGVSGRTLTKSKPKNTTPDLTVSISRTGNFKQRQVGAAYTIKVSNKGKGPTTSAVTVTDTLPTGLTATSIIGTGWTCDLNSLSCTRSDALAVGAS